MPDEKEEYDLIEEPRIFLNRGREVRMFTDVMKGTVRFEGFHVFKQIIKHEITGREIMQQAPTDFSIPIAEEDLTDNMYTTIQNVFAKFETAKAACRDSMNAAEALEAEPDIVKAPANILDATGRIAAASMPSGLTGM